MYLTEENARKKWCPFARTFDGQSANGAIAVASINRNANAFPNPDCLCLASGCMAWRWLTVHEITGYCGLAAKPDEKDTTGPDDDAPLDRCPCTPAEARDNHANPTCPLHQIPF